MIILVTGGTGMVGRAIQRYIKTLETEHVYHFVGSKDADLTELSQTKSLFDRINPTQVIHLAAVVGGLFFNINNNAQMFDLNTRINLNVMRCAVEAGVKKVVAVLSTCAMPAEPDRFPMTEDSIYEGNVHETNLGYGKAKRSLELMSKLYRDSTTTEFVTVFPCNLYGIGDSTDLKVCHALSALLIKCHNAKLNDTDFIVGGTGLPIRQWMFVDDVAQLLIKILMEFTGQRIILCTDEPDISINDLANKICRIVGYTKPLINDLSKSDGLYKKTVSNSVLKKVFPDFKFTSLDNGIRKTYEDVRIRL